MAVNARFYVKELTKSAAGAGNLQVTLAAVTRSTPDNVDWSKFTPSGEIRLFVTQEGAQEFFERRLGQDIAITFADPELAA